MTLLSALLVFCRVCFPSVDIKKVQSGGKTEAFICGMKKRETPLPLSVGQCIYLPVDLFSKENCGFMPLKMI